MLIINFRSIYRHSLRHSPDISFRSHLESGRLPTAWIGQHTNRTHFLFKASVTVRAIDLFHLLTVKIG